MIISKRRHEIPATGRPRQNKVSEMGFYLGLRDHMRVLNPIQRDVHSTTESAQTSNRSRHGNVDKDVSSVGARSGGSRVKVDTAGGHRSTQLARCRSLAHSTRNHPRERIARPSQTFVGPARHPNCKLKRREKEGLLRRILLDTMSSQGGLSRRRVANQSTSSPTVDDSSSNQHSRNGSTNPSSNNTQSQSHPHAGSAFRGGGGIAYDPRDLDLAEEDAKGGKLPRLTIMEEVLLLGLKDKQVSPTHPFTSSNRFSIWRDGGPKPQQFPCTAVPCPNCHRSF